MAGYVLLTEKDFETVFQAMGVETQVVDIPNIGEIVYQISTSNKLLSLRIYSSLDKTTKVSRGVGEDAIRLVFFNNKGNYPLSKGIKIYRVTSKESVQRRIEERMREFLNKVPLIQITDWEYAKAVLANSLNNGRREFAQSLLESLRKYGKLTENQLPYVLGDRSPKGFPTMEANLKRRGWIYDPKWEEDKLPESGQENPQETSPLSLPTPKPEYPPQTGTSAKIMTQIEVLTDSPDMKLQSTEGYPYKFSHFNPVQTLTFPFRNEDCNLVIGANTSSGKTIAAELLIDTCLEKRKKIIYLAPLKALAAEKYEDWKERYSQFKISILTGDYTLSKKKSEELQEADIISMTSEMLDSRTRRMETEKNYWLKEVGIIIVDEAHILCLAERGHPVECGIMRFTSLNKEARILFLSATMPNVDQLGKWLQDLNGKLTRVIYSTWRPVILAMNYVEYHADLDRWGRTSYWSAQEAKQKMTIDIVKSKPNEKFLIFTHDKGTGNKIVSLLKTQGIESKFHNADLDRDERKDLEASFRQRDGGLRVMVSTSTTAYGVNLPARNVIIVGIHRGIQEVEQLDILQESGRAGRYGIDDAGFVYLLIPAGSTGAWQETFAHPRPVTSVMCNHHILAFHVLAEIQNLAIKDARSLLKWYSRSLAYLQGLEFKMEDAQALLDDLEKMEMVIHKAGYYSLTGLGKVSGWLYFSPYVVHSWHKNFNQIFTSGHEIDDLELAWCITDTPDRDFGYIPKDLAPEVEDLKWKLRNRGISASDAIVATLGAYKSLEGMEMEGQVKTLARTLKYDINRIVQALGLIDTMHAQWGKKELWDTLVPRIQYGIPAEMTPLVRLTGIGGARARKLWEAGIHRLQEVVDKPDILKKIFQPAFAQKLRAEARQLLLQPKEG